MLFSVGKRINTPYLTFIVLPTKQHGRSGRVAFIAGKKLGNAVWRNTTKRRMRELFRSLDIPWKDYDVIFLAKSRISAESYSKVLKTCERSLKHGLSGL